MLSLSESGDNL